MKSRHCLTNRQNVAKIEHLNVRCDGVFFKKKKKSFSKLQSNTNYNNNRHFNFIDSLAQP